MGSFLAAFYGYFDLRILLLAFLTTIFLQILSNLANDYGDYKNGADNINRKGPLRAVQSGVISPKTMKRAIVFFATLSFISGILLLLVSLSFSLPFVVMLVIGILAIAAAIKYTAGKNPYGYAGLGDFSVFLFFGLTGVLGTYYLYAGHISSILLLPAFSCGLFSVGVLNLNNMRDIDSDGPSGKITIPVRLGSKKSRVYHVLILALGMISALAFTIFTFISIWQFLYLITFPLFLRNAIDSYRIKNNALLDPYLKQLALSTLAFVVTFGLGLVLSHADF